MRFWKSSKTLDFSILRVFGEVISGIFGEREYLGTIHVVTSVELILRKMMFDTPAVQEDLESLHAYIAVQEVFKAADNVRKIKLFSHRQVI